MRSEHGYTLVELMVAMAAGIVVILAIFAMVDLSASNSAQVAARVDANQRAKPVMQRLMDNLHTACVGPDIAPVMTGSSDTSLTFQAKTGSQVAPTPDKRVVSLEGQTLRERVYPANGGEPPVWTYSATPSSDQQLLTRVSAPDGGASPIFSYFAAQAGQLSTVPLATPLNATDAAKVVQVRVELQVAPSSQPVADANSAQVLSDAATFRFSPFSEDPTKVNGPCA